MSVIYSENCVRCSCVVIIFAYILVNVASFEIIAFHVVIE